MEKSACPALTKKRIADSGALATSYPHMHALANGTTRATSLIYAWFSLCSCDKCTLGAKWPINGFKGHIVITKIQYSSNQ